MGEPRARGRSMTGDEERTARLLLRLKALGSPVRLQILKELVKPSRAVDLHIRAASERAGAAADRFLGRTTLIEHLDVLEEAGLVRRVGELHVTDQQAMVALLEDLGALARLRPMVEVDVEVTRESSQPAVQPLAGPPRALIANGPEAGRAFSFAGPGPWRIGRAPECEVSLAHDPHVSRVHATIERAGDGFALSVSATAKNPVFVDFAAVAPGARVDTHSGALVLVGATLLSLQA